MQRRLDRVHREGGRRWAARSSTADLSYAAAQDDEVDWNLFDIVGIDYYSYFRQRPDHVRELRQYLRWGKPRRHHRVRHLHVRRRPRGGRHGLGHRRLRQGPAGDQGDLVRSERIQAGYLTELLDVFESMGLYAAMAFEFVTADAPHRPDDPRHDLDMASYGITKAIKDRPDDPRSDWHWEPKEAFHALARRYAKVRRHSQ